VRNTAINIAVLSSLFLLPGICSGKEWRGITPLVSTRLDVERILGKPVTDKDVYDTPDGRAVITYSDGRRCEEGLPGLGNIPRDTVVEISLSFKNPVKLSALLLPGREYIQTRAVHTPHVYYSDKVEGVQFSTDEDVVWGISYVGSAADQQTFSCGEYQYAAPVPADPDPLRIEQYPLDTFGKIDFEGVEARLDNFMIQLAMENEHRLEYRGYIIVYAGKTAHPGEAKAMAECAKKYLVKKRNADPNTIVAVDGGYQEEFTVELYIFPVSSYPPKLLPTVSPRKVSLLKDKINPCG
jgi:hypothetical protein